MAILNPPIFFVSVIIAISVLASAQSGYSISEFGLNFMLSCIIPKAVWLENGLFISLGKAGNRQARKSHAVLIRKMNGIP